MGPDRAGDKHHGDKSQSYFRGRYAQPVRFRLSCKDVPKIRIEASSKGHKRAKRAGNVEIKNLLDHAHGPFDRRVIESEVRGYGNQNEKNCRPKRTLHHSPLPYSAADRCRGEPWRVPLYLTNYLHNTPGPFSLIPPVDIRRKATAPSKKRCQNLP